MSTLKFDTWQDRTGVNEFYKCRAWVNFNGTGTVAIRASGNVDSITDNGTGDYTINFTNAMPDADYSGVATGQRTAGNTGMVNALPVSAAVYRVETAGSTGTAVDYNVIQVAIFR